MSSSLGTEAINAAVYGCRGSRKITRTGPLSTMRPAYITATRSHMRATIPKSWVMNSMPRRVRRWMSRSRVRYWSWMVASSAVVGSSAINRFGSPASAMAPTTRCFMPPLIWCG